MKLTPAQKQLLIDIYAIDELYDCQMAVPPTYKPALALVEKKLATMYEHGAFTYIELTKEGSELAFSMTIP